MNSLKHFAVIGLLTLLAAAGTAQAANVAVTADIATSTTWTADNVYNIVGQHYVLPGATLTIQAGTLIKNHVGDQGSLLVCRGAKIYAVGDRTHPIIFTSDADDMHTWRHVTNEWGNLTLCGNGLISATDNPTNIPVVVNGRTNTKTPNALNQALMEGITPSNGSDMRGYYGGGDDEDDSGTLSYVASRYAGKVIGLGNELNAFSMGGIGRGTQVDHLDSMNSVDDFIETWGGKVCYKYLSLWNGGDDGFDYDQGWRGKVQFLLIVQGFSIPTYRGGGISDNGFEMDGAEDSDAQPCSSSVFYNCTFIGQPLSGHSITAWRDNNNAQFRNCIFMEGGGELIHNDNSDGDHANGYGFNGTLGFTARWTTPYTYRQALNAGPSDGSQLDPAVMYDAQTSGSLCEMTDCVFYNNQGLTIAAPNTGHAYLTSDLLGVTVGGGSSPTMHNVVATLSPIQGESRTTFTSTGGQYTLLAVTFLDPRAANDALTSYATAPADGFFTPAPYRGAFSKDNNWLEGWTSAYFYGLTTTNTYQADPEAAIKMTVTTTFPTVAGVLYTVEVSSDMIKWSPVTVVTGTGGTMSVTDLASFDASKFYRVIRQ